MEATKFYVRFRDGIPETSVQSDAEHGFRTQGIETVPFCWVDDIDTIEDLGPTIGIAGYIGDVQRGMEKLGKKMPENVDYPEELTDFLRRKIEKSTLGKVRDGIRRAFIKPVEHKLFSGFIYDRSNPASRRRIVTLCDDVPVFVSNPVRMMSEFRAMILDDEILDVRRYKGDWSIGPSRYTIESAVKEMSGKSPRAYCLDWAVLDNGGTVLVEMNEGYSFVGYGILPADYVHMLSARWHEMTS